MYPAGTPGTQIPGTYSRVNVNRDGLYLLVWGHGCAVRVQQQYSCTRVFDGLPTSSETTSSKYAMSTQLINVQSPPSSAITTVYPFTDVNSRSYSYLCMLLLCTMYRQIYVRAASLSSKLPAPLSASAPLLLECFEIYHLSPRVAATIPTCARYLASAIKYQHHVSGGWHRSSVGTSRDTTNAGRARSCVKRNTHLGLGRSGVEVLCRGIAASALDHEEARHVKSVRV